MRVLVINRNDFVDGGADRVFLNTYDILSGAHTHTHTDTQTQFGGGGRGGGYVEVETFTRQNAGINQEDPRVLSWFGKIRLVKNYLYNKQVARALEQKIFGFKPDIAHVHLIFGTLSGSVLRVLKMHQVPIVMTVHDYRLICPANAMLDRHGKICEKCKKTKYYQCLFRRCSEGNLFFSGVIMLEAYLRKWFIQPIKLIDRFIFVSDFARGKHIDYDQRYAAKSIRLYNMADEKTEMEPVRGDYFLFFGRLSKEKGLITLIKAMKEVDSKLVVAGKGPQEEELRRLRDGETGRLRDGETKRRRDQETGSTRTTHNSQPTTYNLQLTTTNVSFAGFQSGADLERLIRSCSFVVVPSEWYENNPMSVIEAFALGKPVIGSRIGGIPELVTDETGFLFESGNPDSLVEALRKVSAITNPEYIKMSDACRTFALKNFSRTAHLQRLMEVYQKAINRA